MEISEILQVMFVYIRNSAQVISVISEKITLQSTMNEGQLHDRNVEDKTSDSSVPEYAPLSALRESGSESEKDENSSEGEKESPNDEHDVDNANCADSETVEITEKENKEVRSECDVTGKPNRGPIDENECVKGSDSEGVVNNEAMEIEVQDKSEVVEVSSETVDSKVVGEIETVYPKNDSEERSDISADESESEQISYSRTLIDSEKEDTAQHEWKKKLTKVKVKIEPQDSSCRMVNVQIKNEDDTSSSSSSMSTSYGDTKEEEDVKNTEWY